MQKIYNFSTEDRSKDDYERKMASEGANYGSVDHEASRKFSFLTGTLSRKTTRVRSRQGLKPFNSDNNELRQIQYSMIGNPSREVGK